jgi:tripeptidyl-peptidase-2
VVLWNYIYLLFETVMCSCIVLRLRCVEKDKDGRFILHCLQLRPRMVCKTLEYHRVFNISSQTEVIKAFPVRVSIFTVLVSVY